MKIGDLIKEGEWGEVGLIINIKDRRLKEPYGVLCPNGKLLWFSKEYIEGECEVVSEAR